MRFLPLISACLLASCGVSPAGQVTKSYPEAEPSGISLPAMQGFAATAPGPVHRSNTELAETFLRLEFNLENGRPLNHITRFEGPITIALAGNVPTTAQTELLRLIGRLRSEGGVNVQAAAAGDAASITVNFVPGAQMKRLVPTAACFVVPGVSNLAEYRDARGTATVDWAHVAIRQRVAVFVPQETSPQEVRDCLNEELAQALGPLNDLYEVPDSVFNDDNFTTVLSDFDMMMLRLHYAPELRSGMNEAQVASVLPALLQRVNPAGAGMGGHAPSASPVSWTQNVTRAMGLGGNGARRTAAEQMLETALAQGWRDNRLGFSYFILGRLTANSNPAKAVEYLSAARQIYAGLPDGGIHAAHVDLQLAAIALAAGQNEQAVDFANRAIPAITAGQNAAMLASLMMIKSQALEDLGRSAEAQAIRLDSIGWARYGFGSDQAMRAKSAEISALAARG